jgi:hypothetical protein
MNETFLTEELKDVVVNEVVKSTEENSQYFTNISDSLVLGYTSDLDQLMIKIHVDTVENEATDAQLEKYILELSNALYFIGARLEAMGIKDDLSKLAAKQVYNEAYLDAPVDAKGKKPTVAELTAIAEDSSRYETIMNNIYSRAYRQIKYKVDAAYEMLSSIRKIISKRMQDNQLSAARQSGGVVVGREEF